MLMMYMQVLDAKLYTVWMTDYRYVVQYQTYERKKAYNEPRTIII